MAEIQCLPHYNLGIPCDLEPPPPRQQAGEPPHLVKLSPQFHAGITAKYGHQPSPAGIDDPAYQLRTLVRTRRNAIYHWIWHPAPGGRHHLDDRNVGHSIRKDQMPRCHHPESHRRIGRYPPGSRQEALEPSVGHNPVVRYQKTTDGSGLESRSSQEGDRCVGQAGTPAVASPQYRDRILIASAGNIQRKRELDPPEYTGCPREGVEVGTQGRSQPSRQSKSRRKRGLDPRVGLEAPRGRTDCHRRNPHPNQDFAIAHDFDGLRKPVDGVADGQIPGSKFVGCLGPADRGCGERGGHKDRQEQAGARPPTRIAHLKFFLESF